MKKYFLIKIFLIVGLVVVLPKMALAFCQWVPQDNCQKFDAGWTKADADSYCNYNKAFGDTTCCCGQEGTKVGCCFTDQLEGTFVATENGCSAKNGSFFYPYPVMYPSSDRKDCLVNENECFWFLNKSCSDFGSGWIKASSDTLCNGKRNPGSSVCCCGKNYATNVVGCCDLRETKADGAIVQTAEMILRSQCEFKKKFATIDPITNATVGSTVNATFYPDYIVDTNTGKCVPPPDKSEASATATPNPGQVSGEVNFGYGTMTNPLQTVNVSVVVGRVIKAILAILGSIFLMMVIYGGFTWMTAAGNDTKVSKGRNILVWAIIGIIIIFLAWMLVAVIFEALAV